MITIQAIIDDEGRIIFPSDEKLPVGYIGCHIDNINFYFFFTQQEMDDFFENLNPNP